MRIKKSILLIGCIFTIGIFIAGVWIQEQFKTLKQNSVQQYFYMSDFDMKTPTPISIHPIDSFVIHIDDDTWIHQYSEEYREKKKREMHKIEMKK